jgi:hypothetical protein
MNSLAKFAGYLVLWVILWACLAGLWKLPIDLPVKAAKGAVNGIVKMMTPDTRQTANSHPLIDKIYDELESINSPASQRNSPATNPAYPYSPMSGGVNNPADPARQIPGTSYWPKSQPANSFYGADPLGRPINPSTNSSAYPGRTTETAKPGSWSTYPKSNSYSTGPSLSGSSYQNSMVGSTGSSWTGSTSGRR